MHLPALVIPRHIRLNTGLNSLIVNDYPLSGRHRIHNQLKNIQQLPGVASGIPEKSLSLTQFNIPVLQNLIICNGPSSQLAQILSTKRLENEYLTS